MLEASGSSEAWYVPLRLFVRCDLGGEQRVLARWGGWVKPVPF